MKTTKELIEELENEPAFWFAWAILWRVWVISFCIGVCLGILRTIITA